jgi:hypothetical protein
MAVMVVKLVSSLEEVIYNVDRFAGLVDDSAGLQGRLSQFRGWYAHQDSDGNWHFGPSKFIGYEGFDAPTYLSMASSTTPEDERIDGRVTENLFKSKKWFSELDPTSDMYVQLKTKLAAFLDRYGKEPYVNTRINIAYRSIPQENSKRSTHSVVTPTTNTKVLVTNALLFEIKCNLDGNCSPSSAWRIAGRGLDVGVKD